MRTNRRGGPVGGVSRWARASIDYAAPGQGRRISVVLPASAGCGVVAGKAGEGEDRRLVLRLLSGGRSKCLARVDMGGRACRWMNVDVTRGRSVPVLQELLLELWDRSGDLGLFVDTGGGWDSWYVSGVTNHSAAWWVRAHETGAADEALLIDRVGTRACDMETAPVAYIHHFGRPQVEDTVSYFAMAHGRRDAGAHL